MSPSLIAFIFIASVKYSLGSRALIDAEIKPKEPIPTLKLGDTPYVIFRKALNIIEAETTCAITVGRMAVFPEMAEARKVVDLIANISIPFSKEYDESFKKYEFGMDRRYWIGLSDMAREGEWVWMSDGQQLTYDDLWYNGQPDHVGFNASGRLEHCVALWNPIYYEGEKHSFNDESCEHKLYFICEDLTI